MTRRSSGMGSVNLIFLPGPKATHRRHTFDGRLAKLSPIAFSKCRLPRNCLRTRCAGNDAALLEARVQGAKWNSIQHGTIPEGDILWLFHYQSLVDFYL